MIAAVIFIVLAAIFKAVADTCADHYSTSIFSRFDAKFWDKNTSWKYANKLPITSYPIDAWHLSNSAMIICFCAAIVFKTKNYFNSFIELGIAGVLFIVIFNLFYNKILR